MVALARIISAVLLFAVSLDSHLAQVIPDIPTISRAPSPSSVPTVSPSPLISPSSSHSALPSAAPSPAESPTPSLPGVPSESVFPSSPVQTAAVASPEASEGVQGIGIAEATPPAAAAVAPAESPSPNPESSAAVAGASPAPPLASPSPVDESSSGAASEDSNESGTAGDANVSPIPSPAAPSVSQSGIGSGEVPDAADSEPEPTQLTPQPSATSSPSVPSPATTPVIGGGSSTNSPEQPEQGAQPTSKACVRDVSQPRPALGISPSRYAFSVFASAAAVAFANMLYKLAAKWETHEQHMAVRIISIVLARLCIIFSVKLSSALVAVTANSPGIDSGADVGGAYLTWASAILSSLYHESAMMTFIATGYVVQTNTWYPNLRVYLSPWYNHLRNPETDFFDLQNMEESNDSSPGDQVRSRYQALTLFERIKGGRIDRHLLILTALLYVAMELITLIISLLQLLDDLSGTSGKDSVFVDAGDSPEIARCPIRLADLAVCFGTVAVQGVYLLTRQQSLVPLLALTSEMRLKKRRNPGRPIWILRWVTWAILLLWVASLLCLPLLKSPMEPLFIVGDVSLFWYVMIAPPSYGAPSFIVTALFSVCIAAIGAFLIFRLGRASARVHEHT